MKIAVAQTRPVKGNVDVNIESHIRLIDLAISNKTGMIFFPELSITGYEPKLAKDLATHQDDKRLDVFQLISNDKNIVIGIGMPIRIDSDILISMIIFQPNTPRLTYSKQQLHADELPYFVNGNQQIFLKSYRAKIALAICYESLQSNHSENAFRNGAEMYVASVAKSANGIAKARKHFPVVSKQYSMPVLMANCLGLCDDFESVGQSAIWSRGGLLLAQLNETDEGIIVYDEDTENAETYYVK
jgi:predicted amidohydrolase